MRKHPIQSPNPAWHVLGCLALAGSLLPGLARADVMLANGDFYVGFRDLAKAGDSELELERAYNSKTNFSGWFGPGWGIRYEAYLEVREDKSVELHEYGGGANNSFFPAGYTLNNVSDALAIWSEVAREQRELGSDAALAKMRDDLSKSRTRMQAAWDFFYARRLMTSPPLLPGSRLTSLRFGAEWLYFTGNGYEMNNQEGRTRFFDLEGHLRRTAYVVGRGAGHWIVFRYDRNGRCTLAEDDRGHWLSFTLDARGHVTRIGNDRGQSAHYRYDESGNLIFSRDVEGDENSYEYDGHHNLTKIGYGDGKSTRISYYPISSADRAGGSGRTGRPAGGYPSLEIVGNVKSVTARDGTVSSYRYEGSADEYRVSETIAAGGKSKRTSYTYLKRQTPSGDNYLARLTIDRDASDRTVIDYSDAERTVAFTHQSIGWNGVFDYDDQANLVGIETNHGDWRILRGKGRRIESVKLVATDGRVLDPNCSFQTAASSPLTLVSAISESGETIKLTGCDCGRIEAMEFDRTVIFAEPKG